MPGAGKPRFLPPGAAATALSLPPATTTFPQLFNGDGPDRALLREGWRRLLPRAIADPLNPQSWKGGRGHAVSALELPEAPEQPGWALRMNLISLRSALNGAASGSATADGYGFTPPATQPQQRPLAILLDGQFWAESMPVWSPLAGLTREKLPPAVYLLIDAIDNPHRAAELPCNDAFWLAVQEELLPMVHRLARLSAIAPIARWWRVRALAAWPRCSPRSTGPSALAACSASPAPTGGRIAAARDGPADCRLSRGELHPQGLRIWLEAGIREPIIFRANQALLAHLEQQTIFWRQVDGGHDALCWRGGLTAGLIQLWQPLCRDE
jgi:enterochelin esterase family protein